jgi:hypothetical protein
MLAFLLLILVTACYGRSLKDFNAPTLVGRDRDEHGCLTSAGFVYCNYTDKCIRVQEKCNVPTLLLEPEIKPTTRPLIKQVVYEIEI